MAHVITAPCIGVKDAACVDVCPVDCIHGTEESPQLYIHPQDCIDCQLCVEACPVEACYAEEDLPEHYRSYMEINARFYTTSGQTEDSSLRP